MSGEPTSTLPKSRFAPAPQGQTANTSISPDIDQVVAAVVADLAANPWSSFGIMSEESSARQAMDALRQVGRDWSDLTRSAASFRVQYAQAVLDGLPFFDEEPGSVVQHVIQLTADVEAAAHDYQAAGGNTDDVELWVRPIAGFVDHAQRVLTALKTGASAEGIEEAVVEAETAIDRLVKIGASNRDRH
ncbi:MAG TPA: hypothetical protein VGG27_01145 [Magnetospirillaceae bacterium]